MTLSYGPKFKVLSIHFASNCHAFSIRDGFFVGAISIRPEPMPKIEYLISKSVIVRLSELLLKLSLRRDQIEMWLVSMYGMALYSTIEPILFEMYSQKLQNGYQQTIVK